MTCEQFEPWIAAYHDGALGERRRRQVEEHLASCETCQALCEELAQLGQALQAELTYEEAPETLHTRVMRALPEPESVPTGRRGSPPPRGWLTFGLAPIGALATWLLLTSAPSPLVAPVSGPPGALSESRMSFALPWIGSGLRHGRPVDAKAPAKGDPTLGPNGRRRPGVPAGTTADRDAYSEALERLKQLRHPRSRERIAAGTRPFASSSPRSPASPPGPDGRYADEATLQPITVVDYVLPMVQPRALEDEPARSGKPAALVTQAVFEY